MGFNFCINRVIGEEFPAEKIKDRLQELVERLRGEHNKLA